MNLEPLTVELKIELCGADKVIKQLSQINKLLTKTQELSGPKENAKI